jgi:hypothetical protein
MRILFGKCFGLGNAVMSVPAVKALAKLGSVTVLVGSTIDDGGAHEVFSILRDHMKGSITVVRDSAKGCGEFDVAVMSIPFDGRWKNGVHFDAKRVLDGRTRPDPSTVGLVSWERHEVDYQLDNALELGYFNGPQSMRFFEPRIVPMSTVYLGVGYKKNAEWAVKHWGNENFIELADRIVASGKAVVMTGDRVDAAMTMGPIKRAVGAGCSFETCSFKRSFDVVSSCCAYVGNDTGMMHVASSLDVPTVGLFFLQNSIVKNGPRSTRFAAIDGSSRRPTPDEVYQTLAEVFSCYARSSHTGA